MTTREPEERVVAEAEEALERENAELRMLVTPLADRVYWWSRDQEQDEDTVLLARLRATGWRPWHERKREGDGDDG